MKNKLIKSLATIILSVSIFSPVVAYADQPGDPVDTTVLEAVKNGCSGEISVYNSERKRYITYFIALSGDILSVRGTDGTSFSFNITNRSSYVGYNYTTSGAPVKAAQLLLNVYNFRTGKGNSLTPDGLFGPATHSMIQVFQRNNNLSVDSTIGPNTWRKLCSYL